MYVVRDTQCLVCRLGVAILALGLDSGHYLLVPGAVDFGIFAVRLAWVA